MASEPSGVSRPLQTLFGMGAVGGLTDAQLLERFGTRRGEDAEHAFETLVHRHGPMVLRVCRDVLGDRHNAEDAFQATFLVLARKARAIGEKERLAHWLHGVAARTAKKARTASARRLRHERRSAQVACEARPGASPTEDLIPAMREEVERLPRAYREAILLCYLEEMSYAAAAQELRLTEGAVRGRLARARDLLRTRLTRRGIALTAAALGSLLEGLPAEAALPASLAHSTLRAAIESGLARSLAAGTASTQVVALARSVLRSMFMTRFRTIAMVLLIVGGVSAGVGLRSRGNPFDGPDEPAKTPAPGPSAQPGDAASADLKAMQGTWAMSEPIRSYSLVEGKMEQEKQTLTLKWIINADTITTTYGEEGVKEGFNIENVYRFRLDPSQSPKTIELTQPGWGVFPGIYAINGDELKVCYGTNQRPTRFVKGEEQSDPFLFVLKRVSRVPEKVTSAFERAPGCFWAINPTHPGGMTCTIGGVVFQTDDEPAADGSLSMTLAHAIAPGRQPQDAYRVVVFDADRKRYLATPTGSGMGGNLERGPRVELQRFRLDPAVLPARKVVRVAVELVPPDVERNEHQARAIKAMEQARDARVALLPFPELGKSYDFALTSIDGKPIRSSDLKGKVVVIDCWATWCSPCMAKMPALKALYDRRHADGLEVLGVSFDHDARFARNAVERLKLPWPQILVPDNGEVRDLWEAAADIRSLPRILILDRQGKVRADCSPHELEAEVERWLQAK